MEIIEKMYQLQALESLAGEIRKNVEERMKYDITLTEYDYESYRFNSIKDGIVSFTAHSYAGCGTYDYIDYKLPVTEYLEIITGKKELEYKSR